MMRAAVIGGLVAAGLFFAGAASATTELRLIAPAELGVGQLGEVRLVAAPTEGINAIAGTVVYNPAVVRVEAVSDPDSIIRNWIVPPRDDNGVISFAGIIPGGVGPGFGDPLPVFTVLVRGVHEGSAEWQLRDAEVLLNQPDGRADEVTVVPTTLPVREGAPGEAVASDGTEADEVLLRVVREPLLHDGDWTLVYDIRNAQGSVPGALLRERFLGLPAADREVISPARLEDQWRLSILEVRSPDGAVVGREIPWQLWTAWILICAGGIIIAVIVRRFKRR